MAKDMEGITIDGHNTDNLRQYVFFQKGKYLSQKKNGKKQPTPLLKPDEVRCTKTSIPSPIDETSR